MAKTTRSTRERYSPEHDALIARLYKRDLSFIEIAYQLHEKFGAERKAEAVSQRKIRLVADGAVENRGKGKRFATQEALTWYNRTFKTDFGPSRMLVLVDRTVKDSKRKRNGHANGTSVRELIGFSREKGAREPQVTYPVALVRLHRSNPDILGMLKTLLEVGVGENRTAPDMLDDLRAIEQ